jgi:NADPH-dependent F420 reductase
MAAAPSDHAVAIVGGTGALGLGLALRLARAGVRVVVGSRDAARADEAVARVRQRVPDADVSGAENAASVQQAPTVVLAVPFRSQAENLANLRSALQPGQLLVDATVPLAVAVAGRPTRTLGVWQGSAGQQAAEMVPEGVRVVSALHTVSADLLQDLDHPLDEDALLCGDRRADKAEAAALLGRIEGLRCVDCGRLETARIVEPLTALLIGLNARYKVRAGIRITGLPDELWDRGG